MPVRVKIDLDQLRVLQVGVQLAAPEVATTTRLILNRTTVLTPKKTGNLANANQMTMRARRTSVTGSVVNRVGYFWPVHDGARPHVIRAKNAKALAFKWAKIGGMQVFVPKKRGRMGTGVRRGRNGMVAFWIGKGYVNHPGNRARPFMVRAGKEIAAQRGYKWTPGLGRLIG